MTRRELESIRYIDREYRRWKKKLDELNDSSQVDSPKITGMPKRNGVGNPVEKRVLLKALYEDIINGKLAEMQIVRNEIMDFINGIEDYRMKTIVECKCLYCMRWRQIARVVGRGDDEDSIRQRYCRFLKKSGIK